MWIYKNNSEKNTYSIIIDADLRRFQPIVSTFLHLFFHYCCSFVDPNLFLLIHPAKKRRIKPEMSYSFIHSYIHSYFSSIIHSSSAWKRMKEFPSWVIVLRSIFPKYIRSLVPQVICWSSESGENRICEEQFLPMHFKKSSISIFTNDENLKRTFKFSSTASKSDETKTRLKKSNLFHYKLRKKTHSVLSTDES